MHHDEGKFQGQISRVRILRGAIFKIMLLKLKKKNMHHLLWKEMKISK